jgi:hypothetical protein
MLKFTINDNNNIYGNQYPYYLWHCRLGYITETRITKLYIKKIFDPFDYKSYGTYKTCLLGKMTKTPFTRKSERTNELLGLIHTDVCGPITIMCHTCFIIEDHIGYDHVYLIKVWIIWKVQRIQK